MNSRVVWTRFVIVVGLAGMLIGAIDPLEGSFIILPSAGLVALGSLVGRSRHRMLLTWSFALVAIGTAAMVALSSLGGVGGNSGRSMWWALVIVPYPAGWIMGLIGAVLALNESWKHHSALRCAMK